MRVTRAVPPGDAACWGCGCERQQVCSGGAERRQAQEDGVGGGLALTPRRTPAPLAAGRHGCRLCHHVSPVVPGPCAPAAF